MLFILIFINLKHCPFFFSLFFFFNDTATTEIYTLSYTTLFRSILPSKVVPALDEPDLTAILAHEYGHIRRKDFLVHLLCQLTALPVAWHPGIRYLMSKISQTRELACDDYAAVRLGKRIG